MVNILMEYRKGKMYKMYKFAALRKKEQRQRMWHRVIRMSGGNVVTMCGRYLCQSDAVYKRSTVIMVRCITCEGSNKKRIRDGKL